MAKEESKTRKEERAENARKLFDLVRPEAVALGGALLGRGVRAVMNGGLNIRVGAGPAPKKRRTSPTSEEETVAPDVSEGPSKEDAPSVQTTATAATIDLTPEVPTTTVPILGRKMRWRCRHCAGTWSATFQAEMCERCGQPDWRDGPPEEL